MSDTSKDQSTAEDEQRPIARSGDSVTAAESSERTAAPSAGPAAEQPLPLDLVFGILKNRRRRLVLWYLEEVSATSTLSDLAEHLAAIENDKPVEALSSSERKRVYVGLYQGHLPRLHEAGVIEFDDDRGTVARAENASELTTYLDFGDVERPARSRFYLAAAAVGGGLFLAQWLLFPSTLGSALIIAVLLGTVASRALGRRPSADGLTVPWRGMGSSEESS